MPYLMIKTNRKVLTASALILVIILATIIATTRGHFYEVDLFRNEQGWGYDILRDNNIYIHQPFMPAIEGQVPFKDRKSARKTGKLVIKKIHNHESPALTREELESLIGN